MESERHVQEFVEQKGIAYLTLVDQRGDTANTYRVVGVPTNFLINKDQTLIENVDIYQNINDKINQLL